MKKTEKQKLRVCSISPGDLYWFTANTIDDSFIELVNNGKIKMLRTETVEVENRKFFFFKEKKKYRMILVQIITPWVKEDTDEQDI